MTAVGGDIPAEVIALADARARARLERDFARADELRQRIADLGYLVADTPDAYELAVRPPFTVFATSADLLASDPTLPEAVCTVALVVDGWPEDVTTCVGALLEHAPADVVIVGLDCGNVDGAGLTLHELATLAPQRIVELHLAPRLEHVGWADAVTTLLHVCRSQTVAVMDLSTVLDGDALTPILGIFEAPAVVASGWRGVNVDLSDDWRSFVDAPPGEVDAILGYLMVVRRHEALAAPPHPKARFYRNADIEWSLAMRAEGGRLVVPEGPLPVHQERHRAYHDSDPELRERESRRTYERLLQRFRDRPAILSPRS